MHLNFEVSKEGESTSILMKTRRIHPNFEVNKEEEDTSSLR